MINLDSLKSNRDEILKAEIGVLFFNLGKTHAGIRNWKRYFPDVKSLFGGYKKYYEEGYFEKELCATSEQFIFIYCNKVRIPDGRQITWKNFFSGGICDDAFIKKIFFHGCENINSGIDKGFPQDKNQLDNLWISNVFGSFKERVDKGYFDKERESFFYRFHKFLKKKNFYLTPKWDEIRKWVLSEIGSWYSNLLSDSRFPVNDVTLFDQVYMTTSMFKAAMAAMYLDSDQLGKKYLGRPGSIKWSILGIQYDKLGLAEKGLKIPFIKWYRKTSHKVDNELKKVVETAYAIGNEIYRDETGIYFIVPENIKGNSIGEFYELHRNLYEFRESVYKIFFDNFEGEVYPTVLLTKPSRGLMNLGNLIESSRENYLKLRKDKFLTLNKLEQNNGLRGICQICKVRLANKIDNDEEIICSVCYKRKKSRIDDWICNLKDETIWIDELQDRNSRIALITLKFELEKWLNGDLLNTFVVQNLDLNNEKYIKYLEDISNAIKNNKKVKDTVLKDYCNVTILNDMKVRDLAEKWLLERSIGSKWESFISSNIEFIDFENRKITWNGLNDTNIELIARFILQFFLRKNPSPARLRRIWETTKEFFKSLESEIVELAGISKQKQERWYWTDVDANDGEYKDGNILFYVKDKKAYMIAPVEKVANKKEFTIIKNKNLLKCDEAKKQIYKPYFTILSPTPISWQFIIPAENVPTLIENVQKKYYESFKLVYGKLPLHMGIVIQNYRKPLYIGIQALRKIRRDNIEWKYLGKELFAKEIKARQKAVSNYFDYFEKFYSYFEKTSGEGKYEFYLYPENDKKWLDIVRDCLDQDKFVFYPNTFDFEFLDSNVRRNDIYYKKDGKRLNKQKFLRPYDITNWKSFKQFKQYFSNQVNSLSKLQKLISLIYSKIEDWDNNDSLKQFMISAFVNILDLKQNNEKDAFANILGEKSFEELKRVNPEEFKKKLYLLIDMFEFWHLALKEI